MVQVEQEKQFRIFKNAVGDLMFLIRARLDNPEQPRIVYDGNDHALFYRNDKMTILLDYIHPEIREDLKRARGVLVVEIQSESIIREYAAEIKILKEMPLPAEFEKI